MKFERHAEKAKSIATKHGVTFAEAATFRRSCRYRAVYRLSTDGLNFGPFVALKPQGGDGQTVLTAAVEACSGSW